MFDANTDVTCKQLVFSSSVILDFAYTVERQDLFFRGTHLYCTIATFEQRYAQFHSFQEDPGRVVVYDEIHHQVRRTLLVQMTLDK